MKVFLLTLIVTLNVHANENILIKNEYSAQYEQISNLIHNNNIYEANNKLKNLYNKDLSNKPFILSELSHNYQKLNQHSKFISFLAEKINRSPFDLVLNKQLAKEYLANNNPDKSCDTAKFMLNHTPKKEKFYPILVKCSVATEKSAEALTYINKMITKDSDPELYLIKAEQNLKLNNLADAKIDLENYFLRSKPTEQAFKLKSELYLKQNTPEKLTELYLQCLNLLNKSALCFEGYLNSTRQLNSNFKSEHYNKHKSYYADYPKILTEMGFYYQQLGSYDLAEELYLSAYNKNSSNIETVTYLFNLYKLQSNSQKAYDIVGNFLNKTANTDELQTALNLQRSLFDIKAENSEVVSKPDLVADTHNQFYNEDYKKLYLSKQYSNLILKIRKKAALTDSEYFILGNSYYHLKSYGNAKLFWNKIKPTSVLYYKSVFNLVVTMRLEGMITASTKQFNSIDFPLNMYPRSEKFKTILNKKLDRLPAQEKQKNLDELTELLYLEWEL